MWTLALSRDSFRVAKKKKNRIKGKYCEVQRACVCIKLAYRKHQLSATSFKAKNVENLVRLKLSWKKNHTKQFIKASGVFFYQHPYKWLIVWQRFCTTNFPNKWNRIQPI